jgi:hypothetical protein
MKRTFLVIFFVAFIPVLSWAGDTQIAIKIGEHSGSATFDPEPSSDAKSRSGMIFGISLGSTKKGGGARVDLLYIQKGYKLSDNDPYFGSSTYTVKIDELVIAPFYQMKMFEIGPEIGIKSKHSYKFESSGDGTIQTTAVVSDREYSQEGELTSLADINVSFNIGVLIPLGSRIAGELRYNAGLTDISKGDSKIRTNGLQAILCFYLSK